MTVFYKIYFCKNAVLLQIYISVKKQLSCGTVFLHNTCIYIAIYIQLLCSGPRYCSVHFLLSTGRMCKFSRTLYNRQLIQFARIPVEFVVRFIRYQNRVKVMTFFTAAQYLLLISPYSSCLRDLRVQFLELYTACTLSQYHWDKAFHFPGKFHFLVKTITDSVRLGVVYLNLVLSTVNEVMFCKIYLKSAVHDEIPTIHDLFKTYFISSFF